MRGCIRSNASRYSQGRLAVIYVQGSGAILLPFCHWPVLAKSASSQAIPSQQEEQRWKEASVLDFSDCRRKVLLEYTRGRSEQGETVKVWIWILYRDERRTFAIESQDEMLVASLLQELCWMQIKTNLAIYPLSRYGGSLSVRLQWMQSGASCSHCSHDHGSRCRTKRELWRTQEWTGRKKKRTRTTCFSLKVSRHPVVPGAYAIPRGPWRVRASMGLSAAL